MYTSCGRSLEVPPGISDIASDPGFDIEIVRICPEGGKIVGICGQLVSRLQTDKHRVYM